MLDQLEEVRKFFEDMSKSHNLNNLLMRIQYKVFCNEINCGDLHVSEIIKSEICKEIESIDICRNKMDDDKIILNEIIKRVDS